jgi:hypothetical protein
VKILNRLSKLFKGKGSEKPTPQSVAELATQQTKKERRALHEELSHSYRF